MKNHLSSKMIIAVSVILAGFLCLWLYVGNHSYHQTDLEAIYLSYWVVGILFLVAMAIKMQTQKNAKPQIFIAGIVGTLILKLFVIIALLVFIYSAYSKQTLQSAKFFILAFFAFCSLLEIILLGGKKKKV